MMVRRVARNEEGVTLSEVMVGAVLAMVVTALMVAGAGAIYRGTRYSSQDSASLASGRIAKDKMVRELRSARRIYDTSTAQKAVFWLDINRDFLQDSNEKITWELVASGSGANLVRYTAAAPTPVIQARNLILADAFTYQGTDDPTLATLVRIVFAARGSGNTSGSRTIQTEVRIRNSDPTAGSVGGSGDHVDVDDEGD